MLQPLMNSDAAFDELVQYVPQLQKINKSLQRAKSTVGSSYDTKSFRDGVNDDVSLGINIVDTLAKIEYEFDPTDNKSDKMWTEALSTKHKFKLLKADIEQKLIEYELYEVSSKNNILSNIDQAS
eukprot:UN06175